MATSTAAMASSGFYDQNGGPAGNIHGGLGFFGQQLSNARNRANRKRWNKMSDAEVRALYEKGGRKSKGAWGEIQRRQTLGNFGMEAAGGNNVVGGDSDNRLVDIESRLAALEGGGGESVAEGAGVGGGAIAAGGFDAGTVGAAEDIYGTEDERMSAAGASMMNDAAISGL
tara:strand:- start:195 stop:707 length:513 start_codon:yes stop_codon:yes gene_type:complete